MSEKCIGGMKQWNEASSFTKTGNQNVTNNKIQLGWNKNKKITIKQAQNKNDQNNECTAQQKQIQNYTKMQCEKNKITEDTHV